MEEALRTKNNIQPVVRAHWDELLQNSHIVHQLENQVFPAYLKRMRWFGGKSRLLTSINLYQYIPVPTTQRTAYYILLKVRYPDGPTEIYVLPLVFIPAQVADEGNLPSEAIVARLENDTETGFLADGIYDETFRTALFNNMVTAAELHGNHYPWKAQTGKLLGAYSAPTISSRVLKAEQSNSSIIYNDTFFLKLFRKVEYTINPDLEIIRFLTAQDRFHHIPAFAGAIELFHPEKPSMLLALLQQMIPNKGDAWAWFLDRLDGFYRSIDETGFRHSAFPGRPRKHTITWKETPAELQALIGEDTCQRAMLLGKRTAELHLALAAENNLRDFVPEPIGDEDQKKLGEGLLKLVDLKFELLMRNLIRVPELLQQDAKEMLEDREKIKDFITRSLNESLGGQRIRIHGDYHLGQALVTENDFVILDFEGEPDKPHAERRLKYPPLKDVAGMMRSFRYAAYASLFRHFENDRELRESMIPVADLWYHYVSRYFLGAYLQGVKGSGLIPEGPQLNVMLRLYSFEKAIYEMGYEINNRPDWVIIPLISLVKFVKFYLDEEY